MPGFKRKNPLILADYFHFVLLPSRSICEGLPPGDREHTVRPEAPVRGQERKIRPEAPVKGKRSGMSCRRLRGHDTAEIDSLEGIEMAVERA